MSDENAAAAGSEVDAAPIVSAPNLDSGESLSVEQALDAYAKRTNTAESADDATAGTESADEADAAPEGTTVDDAGDEPEVPAIDPPKSWSKEAHERWSKLDRETQEFLAARESEDQKAIKRSLNEAAEQRKAAAAEREQWEKGRQDYETKIKSASDLLERAQFDNFPDIRTFEDYQRLSNEAARLVESDPFASLQIQARLKAFDTHNQKLQLLAAETKRLDGEKSAEKQGRRNAYEAEQSKLLSEMVPEMADPVKANDLRNRAVTMLQDELGLKLNDLQRWMADDVGHEILSNAGIQKLIVESLRLKDIKAAPPKAIPKPVPAVQKPGVAASKSAVAAESVQNLRNKLVSSGSVEDAFALYEAKQRRRAS